MVAARLGEILAGDHPEAGREGLEQHRHEIAHDEHPDELVAEARAAGEVGRPVARVHVADAHQVGGPGEGEHAPEPAGAAGDHHAAVDLGQRALVVPATRGGGEPAHGRSSPPRCAAWRTPGGAGAGSTRTPSSASLPVTILRPPTSSTITPSSRRTSRTRTVDPGTRPTFFQCAMRPRSWSRSSRTTARA